MYFWAKIIFGGMGTPRHTLDSLVCPNAILSTLEKQTVDIMQHLYYVTTWLYKTAQKFLKMLRYNVY